MSGVARMVPALVVLASVLVQVSVVQHVEVVDSSPDVVVLVIVSIALLTSSVDGALHGFLAGVAIAMFAALPLGPHAMLGVAIGYWAGRWGESLVTDEHPVPPLVAGVVATMAMHVGRPAIEFLMSPAAVSGDGVLASALIVTALNAVLAVPVYTCVRVLLGVGVGRTEEAGAE